MRPIVDGLQGQYGDRVAFQYLNAADSAAGEAAFKQLSLPGHPAFVIFSRDRRETYRGVGIIEAAVLEQQVAEAVAEP